MPEFIKSFFICFLSAKNGLEHLCAQSDRAHIMRLEVWCLAQNCCLEGAGPSACAVSASESCEDCGRLRHLGDQSNSVWERWWGGKVMREKGDIRASGSFWQLGPKCLGQHVQEGRRRLDGCRINLSISQYQWPLISGNVCIPGLTSLLWRWKRWGERTLICWAN